MDNNRRKHYIDAKSLTVTPACGLVRETRLFLGSTPFNVEGGAVATASNPSKNCVLGGRGVQRERQEPRERQRILKCKENFKLMNLIKDIVGVVYLCNFSINLK